MPNIPVFVKVPPRPIQNLFRIRSFFFVSWSLLKKLKTFSVFYYSFVVLKSLLLEYCFTCFNYKKRKVIFGQWFVAIDCKTVEFFSQNRFSVA